MFDEFREPGWAYFSLYVTNSFSPFVPLVCVVLLFIYWFSVASYGAWGFWVCISSLQILILSAVVVGISGYVSFIRPDEIALLAAWSMILRKVFSTVWTQVISLSCANSFSVLSEHVPVSFPEASVGSVFAGDEFYLCLQCNCNRQMIGPKGGVCVSRDVGFKVKAG